MLNHPTTGLPLKRLKRFSKRQLIPYLIFALVVVFATIGVQKYLDRSQLTSGSTALALTGKKALSEDMLRKLIVSEGLTAYWIGPRDGDTYALSTYADGQVFVRYLPNEKALKDKTASYTVIGTYPLVDAFAVTKKAGSSANGVGFVNQDGDAVFYSTIRPASVYVGLKKLNYQVEIYDPSAGQALLSASTPNLLVKIS
ncbi:MAG: hypothetical protein WDO06_03590 [Actinomycetota bacterium]